MKYEERVVAFIDILGFKSILSDTVVKDSIDDEKKIDEIVTAYESIRDIWGLDEKSKIINTDNSESKRVTIFSDSIVVSFKAEEPSEVFYTLLELKWLIMRLLWRGMLCRGAISIGKFIHTEEFLFGPALVEAYLLESKAAIYPRIILDRSIVDIGVKNCAFHHTKGMELREIESLLDLDSDGMYYIDYFFKAMTELDDPEYDFPAYIDNLGNIIRKGLMASSHESKAALRIKYLWMRERYNKMVATVTSDKVINEFQSLGKHDLARYYSALKPISPNRYLSKKKHTASPKGNLNAI